jgi:uncharacterized protein involved in high-affinity Fe2+ transport
MKKTSQFLTVMFLIILLSPSISSAGEEDLVGTKVIGDMRIEFYMEHPKQGMVMTSGKKMPMMNPGPTHHPEVKVFDTDSGKFIPYLDVEAVFVNLTNNRYLFIDIPAMLGSYFHYGRNAALPGKGKYKIFIKILPQELMRYARMANKWATAVTVSFEYEYK